MSCIAADRSPLINRNGISLDLQAWPTWTAMRLTERQKGVEGITRFLATLGHRLNAASTTLGRPLVRLPAGAGV